MRKGMKKGMKTALITAGTVTAGAAAVGFASYKVSQYFIRLALDRDGVPMMQRSFQKVCGNVLTEDVVKMLNDTGEALKGKCQTVRTKNRTGLDLVGHWRPCQNPKRIIIAMHGWRSCWARDFGAISEFWYDNGCSVLFAEQQGQGESGGKHMGFGMLERYDCLSWIQWVNEQTGGSLPIYLAGISMGATTVLMAAGMDLPENVHGIIADCGFTSADAIWKHVAQRNLHLCYRFHAAAANAMCRKRIHMGAKDYSTVDAMLDCNVPVLFIHGAKDRFVPVEMTYKTYEACHSTKYLLVVPGADHGMSYWIEREKYQDIVMQFWNNHDKKRHT